MKDQLVLAIADLEEAEALQLAREMLDGGVDPQDVLEAGKEGMKIVGERFEQKEYFLPELILSGELLQQIGELVKPKLSGNEKTSEPLGKVVIGTVAGDIHDIGKDIVTFMLDAGNFEVHDLGVDVPAQAFVQKIKEVQPEIIGLSGFLTLAFEQMRVTVQAIQEAGLRDQVKIMIGGAPMDETAAKFIGADAYGKDATAAVHLAKGWVGGA
jgi:5-methyltetrahydrofolate--homocysteine methyltransferase